MRGVRKKMAGTMNLTANDVTRQAKTRTTLVYLRANSLNLN